MPGPLEGVRILDLSRVLAGPSCTQLLGDLGADIVKIERPGVGDETRTWGPPFVVDEAGRETAESGYFLSTNRNKRSVTIDFAKPEGAGLVRRLLGRSDVLVENFKVGGLAGYGLAYEQLRSDFPRLIYCSITGFGQTGPYAPRPGYDMLVQGAGGIMSITGEPDRPPVKVGVAVNDVITGLYAAVGVLSALRHRDVHGVGQRVDLGLLDVGVAWLYNVALNYLLSGEVPRRLGTAHPNTVPYQVFPSKDGFFILAAGNDHQYRRFCAFAGRPDLAEDPRFATNAGRVRNRQELVAIISGITEKETMQHWLEGLERHGVPCGPVNTIDQVFADPQVVHREMKITMPYPGARGGAVPLVGSPLKLSETPVTYRAAPPRLGQDTDDVLDALLSISPEERTALRKAGVI
jgi:crotonobetainyl-CoA:carnitine CoA-transferase CaiB-like acyl-CoA transferase